MISEVYNIDCFKWLSQYDGQFIDLIVTDPPYDIPNTKCGKSFMADKVEWLQELESDTLTKSFDIEKFADLVCKVQNGKINIYLFCNKLQIPQYFQVFANKYKCKFDILCWHKNNALPTFNCKYLTDTEYILYFRNRGGV